MWTYFNNLKEDEFPTPEELFKIALSLYDNYSTPRAGTIFASGYQPNGSVVPIGEPWKEDEDTEPKPVPEEACSTDAERREGDGEGGQDPKQKGVIPAEDEVFDGDRTLMRSALFMYEVLVSKEVAQAVAEGDIGRVYEGIKVSHQHDLSLSLLTGCS